jgi:hypothetical protein
MDRDILIDIDVPFTMRLRRLPVGKINFYLRLGLSNYGRTEWAVGDRNHSEHTEDVKSIILKWSSACKITRSAPLTRTHDSWKHIRIARQKPELTNEANSKIVRRRALHAVRAPGGLDSA